MPHVVETDNLFTKQSISLFLLGTSQITFLSPLPINCCHVGSSRWNMGRSDAVLPAPQKNTSLPFSAFLQMNFHPFVISQHGKNLGPYVATEKKLDHPGEMLFKECPFWVTVQIKNKYYGGRKDSETLVHLNGLKTANIIISSFLWVRNAMI